MPTIALTYASRRSEVWRWYWRVWREKLWMYHAYCFVFFPLMAVLLFDSQWPPQDYRHALYGLLVAAAIVAFFIAFPQIVFKPQVRQLAIGEDGISTTIGKKSKTFEWGSVTEVEDTPNFIMIRRTNGNAFLIPDRAFNSEQEKGDFLAAIKALQARPTAGL
jgi:hypothetical protein